MASIVIDSIAPGANAQIIEEGSEPNDFWKALGGKGDYDKELDKPGAPLLEPRLFHFKVFPSGKLQFEEIDDFEQEDLDEDDVMLCDGGDELYVWEGKGSSTEEKEKSLKMAQVRTDQINT